MRKLIALLSTKDKTPEELCDELLRALQKFEEEQDEDPIRGASDQVEGALRFGLLQSRNTPENFRKYLEHERYMEYLWRRVFASAQKPEQLLVRSNFNR